MSKLTLLLKFSPYVVIALLLGCIWWYRNSASGWQDKYNTAQQNIVELQKTNTDLDAINTALNNRNISLVESLNERSDQLEAETRRANANRTAYKKAIGANHDWADEPVPQSVADSLRAGTSDLQTSTSGKDSATE